MIDASAALEACLSRTSFEPFATHQLVAPHLLVSEVLSGLRGLSWRSEISDDLASAARSALETCPIEFRRPAGHLQAAWDVSAGFGWAKTCDAEYVALARDLDLPLLTLDARLARGVAGTVRVVTPAEL